MTISLQTTFMHVWDISPTFAMSLIISLIILSSLVTPLIHLNTLVSSIYCDFFTAHVHWCLPGFSLLHTYPYYQYIIIWQSLLPIANPDFLTRHSIVRLPCFSVRCRTANSASAIPLPGIKPNFPNPSIYNPFPNLQSISALSLCNPHNPGCLTPLSQ